MPTNNKKECPVHDVGKWEVPPYCKCTCVPTTEKGEIRISEKKEALLNEAIASTELSEMGKKHKKPCGVRGCGICDTTASALLKKYSVGEKECECYCPTVYKEDQHYICNKCKRKVAPEKKKNHEPIIVGEKEKVEGWEKIFDKGFVWEQCCSSHFALFRVLSGDDPGDIEGHRTLAKPEYVKAFIRVLLLSKEEEEKVKNASHIIAELDAFKAGEASMKSKVREEIEKMISYRTSNNGREPYDWHGYSHAIRDLLASELLK